MFGDFNGKILTKIHQIERKQIHVRKIKSWFLNAIIYASDGSCYVSDWSLSPSASSYTDTIGAFYSSVTPEVLNTSGFIFSFHLSGCEILSWLCLSIFRAKSFPQLYLQARIIPLVFSGSPNGRSSTFTPL